MMSHHQHAIKVTQSELEELVEGAEENALKAVPVLQHKAENRVSREMREVALRGCARELEAFAACSSGRTLSVVWACRVQNRAMDGCMKTIGRDEVLRNEMRRR